MGCHSLLQRIFPTRDWNHAFCIRALTGEFFTTSTTWEAPQSTMSCVVLFLVTQPYPTLCNPMDCSQPGFSVHGDSPGNNTWVGCHALLQGIFPTHRLNAVLPHCRVDYLPSEPQGKPKNTQVVYSILNTQVAYPFSRGTSWPGIKPWSLHCRWILYPQSYQGSLYRTP